MKEFIVGTLGILLGWLLTSFTKYSDTKKEDKKKLRRLLFNLLELRFQLTRRLNLEAKIEKYLQILFIKIENKTHSEIPEEIRQFCKETLKKAIEGSFFAEDDRLITVEKKITQIIDQLSEVLPLLAYQLNGQYEIKNYLHVSDNLFSNIENDISEQIPNEVKGLLKPKVTSELLNRLTEGIVDISKSISRKTYKEVVSIIELQDDDKESDEMANKLIDESFEKMANIFGQA